MALTCARRYSLTCQEPSLFAGTIRDNIAYGRPGASSEEVEFAARAAHVSEFADRFPAGLDTPVSEAGLSLSGGQRQRVAIARALLRDAPIVILDEPTNGLDPISETLVMDGLRRLSAGRTVLVIAHRLRTLTDVDAIHVLDGGRIVESGTHHQLAVAGGRYAALLGSADTATDTSGETTISSAGRNRQEQPAPLPIRHSAVGIVSRAGRHGPEILLVHRSRQRDWGLPKGCLESGESVPDALAREMAEETGLPVDSPTEIAESLHLDRKGRRRHFHYLLAVAPEGLAAAPDGNEIDRLAWKSLDEAVFLIDNARERTVVLMAGQLLGADAGAFGRCHGPRALLLMRAGQAHLDDEQPGALEAPLCLQGYRELASLAPIVQWFDPATIWPMPWSRAFDSVRVVAGNLQATLEVHEPAQLVDAAVAHHQSGDTSTLICADEETILRALISLRAQGVILDSEPRARRGSLWVIGQERATYLAPIMQAAQLRTGFNGTPMPASNGRIWAAPAALDGSEVAAS